MVYFRPETPENLVVMGSESFLFNVFLQTLDTENPSH